MPVGAVGGGLAGFGVGLEQVRGGVAGRVFSDGRAVLASDFEGGNGTDIAALGEDHYVVRLEPEVGEHRFAGRGYYFCFGVQNLLPERRVIRVRCQARWWREGADEGDTFGNQSRHVVIRRGDRWSEYGPESVHQVPGEVDSIDVDVELAGSDEPDPVLIVSNFHWYPYSELVQWLHTLPAERARVIEIARSHQGRPIYAVEMGRNEAPCMVHAQTSQASEMLGMLACKALIEFTCSDDPAATKLRDNFRVCVIPVTNPDGAVAGLGVSDPQGQFPHFQAHLAAAGDAGAPVETRALWNYLVERQPLLYWEWHSNNWDWRPGHMLIRYRPELLEDPDRRQQWEHLDEQLLTLPDTHHENWTSHTEGPYQPTMGFQAIVQLGAIAMMIKPHERFSVTDTQQHAIDCLRAAGELLAEI